MATLASHTGSQDAAKKTPWRVALLEDNLDTRQFFEAGIRGCSALELVASFGSIALARAWFASNAAHVFLTDIGLPDALSLIRELSQLQPDCEILVVSMFGDENTVLSCIEAGALGYIHKDSTPTDIAQTILDLKQGASHISPMIARKLLGRLRSPFHKTKAEPDSKELAKLSLTTREAEVLDLIAKGYAYAEIARLTSLSVHTVQWHIKNLYSKLAVHSRSEAVFEASRIGFLK
jgi:DNA-binding NarL/FixJ family response regulator